MSEPMRDGTTASDIRLGRLKQRDVRSANFPFRLLGPVADREPRSYTWPCYFHSGYQNGWGGCVGWTVAKEAAAKPVVVNGVNDQTALDWYFRIQDGDEWPGSERPGDVPQAGGTSVLAAAKFMQALGHWPNYVWASTVREVATAVSWHGPVVIGVDWLTGCMDTDPNGYIHLTGQVEGGHAVLLRGYNHQRRTFVGTNHWWHRDRPWGLRGDEGWGQPGDFLVDEDTVAEWIHRQGDMVVPTRHKVTPV